MNLDEEELVIFEVAFLLKMPVYKLMEEMPYEELMGWCEFFRENPPGVREDQRTAFLLMSNGVKDATKLFPSLSIRKKTNNIGENILKSNMMQFISRAIGGDKLGESDEN